MEREVELFGESDDTGEGPRIVAVYSIPDQLERRRKVKLARREEKKLASILSNTAKQSNEIPDVLLDRCDRHVGIKVEPSSPPHTPNRSLTNMIDTIPRAVKRPLEDDNESVVFKKEKMDSSSPQHTPSYSIAEVNDAMDITVEYSTKKESECDEVKEEEVECKIRVLTPDQINARCTIEEQSTESVQEEPSVQYTQEPGIQYIQKPFILYIQEPNSYWSVHTNIMQ